MIIFFIRSNDIEDLSPLKNAFKNLDNLEELTINVK